MLDDDTKASIVKTFAGFNVRVEHLEKNFGPMSDWHKQDRDVMLSVYSDLSAGKLKAKDITGE